MSDLMIKAVKNRLKHNNYKTYSDGYDEIDFNPINAAFKMWQKCVLGFEYYLNNRNRLNSEAWHNNSFFESIEDFQVIDDLVQSPAPSNYAK